MSKERNGRGEADRVDTDPPDIASAAATEARKSCWVDTAPGTTREVASPGSSVADVAVVGGGIVGLTTALLLARAGCSVVLFEAMTIGRQVTGRSTAKVTVQHGLHYTHVREAFGDDAVRTYGQANSAALQWILDEVETGRIDCDLERRAAVVYTTDRRRSRDIEREVDAMASAGIHAELAGDLRLPFATESALRVEGQAQFHPVKYLDGLARQFEVLGGTIVERTRVRDVSDGTPCTVKTAHGDFPATAVVLATHLPILDRGAYFARAFPRRHMCLAAPIPAERAPDAMYIGVDEPTRSFRTAPWSRDERLLVAIGESFPTGHGDPGRSLDDLERFVGRHFGVTEISHRWGNQDYYSSDGLPFVGAMPGAAHIRMATGFSAWGITTGTAAARILADSVLNRPNPWAETFDAGRIGLKGGGARSIVEENLDVAKSWVKEQLDLDKHRAISELAPGDGGIVRSGDGLVAAFRDERGTLHQVDARCTHLGCGLQWNATERSWDCECHGSRFDVDGRILHGPAVEELEAADRPGEGTD